MVLLISTAVTKDLELYTSKERIATALGTKCSCDSACPPLISTTFESLMPTLFILLDSGLTLEMGRASLLVASSNLTKEEAELAALLRTPALGMGLKPEFSPASENISS